MLLSSRATVYHFAPFLLAYKRPTTLQFSLHLFSPSLRFPFHCYNDAPVAAFSSLRVLLGQSLNLNLAAFQRQAVKVSSPLGVSKEFLL